MARVAFPDKIGDQPRIDFIGLIPIDRFDFISNELILCRTSSDCPCALINSGWMTETHQSNTWQHLMVKTQVFHLNIKWEL